MRTQSQPSVAFTCGNIKIDPQKHIVTTSGNEIKLTKKEYAILLLLFQNKDKVLTHNAILSHIWGAQYID
ncbi:winged helix-turn-helix domain-containing protein, partial [Pseudoalteromonas sp. GW168-MNA-CIBAN-0100]|uniref:winged helix-turn-helix domain-containing protein n=1 Tax=Pseudoalteromonas sp. GW168-MNA-CIBAN-0100 TaxID=3140434 RepID=UPI003316BBCE